LKEAQNNIITFWRLYVKLCVSVQRSSYFNSWSFGSQIYLHFQHSTEEIPTSTLLLVSTEIFLYLIHKPLRLLMK